MVPSYFTVEREGRILRMTPGSPHLDREAFQAELAAAAAYAKQEGVPVVWHHNGVYCSTDELAHHIDAWAIICEKSAHMAN